MQLKIDPEFRDLIPPLSDAEFKQLEANLLEDGCRDALVIWEGTLVDGHNRYRICTEHELPFQTVEKQFNSREDAIIWICKNQIGRRNATTEQLSYLRGKQYEAEKQVQGTNNQHVCKSEKDQNDLFHCTASRIASEHGVGEATIKRDAKFARAVDAIGETAPATKQKILAGQLHAKKKDIIAVGQKPIEERAAIIAKVERGESVADLLADPDPELKTVETKVCARCGRVKQIVEFPPKRNTCYECRAETSHSSTVYDLKGRPIEVSEEVKKMMEHTSDSVAKSITDINREVHYGIDEFMMELQAVLDTCVRQTKDSLEEHPEIVAESESRQKIIAALSEAGTAINTIKESLYNE